MDATGHTSIAATPGRSAVHLRVRRPSVLDARLRGHRAGHSGLRGALRSDEDRNARGHNQERYLKEAGSEEAPDGTLALPERL